MDADRCVMCGAIIPEGRMICPTCERKNGTCGVCRYHDDFSGVCFQGYSPKAADFTDDDDTCDFWESGAIQNR